MGNNNVIEVKVDSEFFFYSGDAQKRGSYVIVT